MKGVRQVPTFEDLLAAFGNPQSPQAQAVFAGFTALGSQGRDSYTDFSMPERCLLDADVPMVPQIDGNVVEIIQGRDHVVLVADWSRRVVALGGRRPADTLRHWTGISTGRWEGETLVVDTRNFSNRMPSFAGFGDSRDKIVTERFTRTANDRLEYAATIVDPRTFQDRIELSFPMMPTDARIYEGACHEGNRSMRNSLAAARLDDDARKRQRQQGPRQQLTVLDRAAVVVARIGEPGCTRRPRFRRMPAESRPSGPTSRRAIRTSGRSTSPPAVGVRLHPTERWTRRRCWSPDGKTVAYASSRDNIPTVFRRAADGTGAEEELYRHTAGNAVILTDWSRDGRFITFWAGQGLFVLPLSGDRDSVAVADGRGGRFSPDGRWLAYNATGATQAAGFHAFVRPFDSTALTSGTRAPARQISQSNALGGINWRSDGKQLFFLSQPPGQTMMVVDVTGTDLSAPRVLFQLPPGVTAPAQLSSISSPDGDRFVFALPAPK